MGSYWTLEASDTALLTGKNYVPDELMLLFTDQDRTAKREEFARLAARWEAEEDVVGPHPRRLFAYRATVGALRERLRLQGFGPDRVRTAALDYLRDELADGDRYVPEAWAAIEASMPVEEILEAALASAIASHTLIAGTSTHSPRDQYIATIWDDLREVFDDPRFALALLLGDLNARCLATLELTDLVLGGWMEPDEVPHRLARRRRDREIASSGKVIVVTEGSSDAHILGRVLALARPAIADQFSFLDFDGSSAPGGTDRVVSLTRGLAAANVSNRVVAVLDNDTAGRLAEATLRRGGLPDRFSIARLPFVAYGRRYPTLGPDGLSSSDINGRAASIELMFGPSLLRGANRGVLPPVRWTGYVQKLDAYQGSLTAKGAVQAAIADALDAPNLRNLHPEAAAGCRRLAEVLVAAVPQTTPMMSSESSPLLRERADD